MLSCHKLSLKELWSSPHSLAMSLPDQPVPTIAPHIKVAGTATTAVTIKAVLVLSTRHPLGAIVILLIFSTMCDSYVVNR